MIGRRLFEFVTARLELSDLAAELREPVGQDLLVEGASFEGNQISVRCLGDLGEFRIDSGKFGVPLAMRRAVLLASSIDGVVDEAMLRPLFKPVDPASRTEYQPGELAQCDLWFPPVDIPLGFGHVGRPPVLVLVSGYSRIIAAIMIPTRQSPDLLAGHWALLSGWGRVPRTLVWDNESAVGQWRGGKPQLTETMNAFRGSLGIKVIQCRPRDPEAKGLVERANGYLETSFLPGRVFAGPADFNAQLGDWLGKANQRHHRRLECRPVDRWDADRGSMLELPPVDPVVGWRFTTRLPRDHYVADVEKATGSVEAELDGKCLPRGTWGRQYGRARSA